MAKNPMSVRDVARATNRSEETVRRWIWSGRLAATKLGNQLFVKREDLEAILEPRAGESSAAYKTSSRRPALFDEYDYSPLQATMEEYRGRSLPSAEEEARRIIDDAAFQARAAARFGAVDVLQILDRESQP